MSRLLLKDARGRDAAPVWALATTFLRKGVRPLCLAMACIEPPYGSTGLGKAGKLGGHILLQSAFAQVVWDEQIGRAEFVTLFDESYRTAFRPAAIGRHHVHHKLSVDVQAHD
jgi:hypothetical protein